MCSEYGRLGVDVTKKGIEVFKARQVLQVLRVTKGIEVFTQRTDSIVVVSTNGVF